jgi:hypothetical protein
MWSHFHGGKLDRDVVEETLKTVEEDKAIMYLVEQLE